MKRFVMTYKSSFPFESSHFNGPEEYNLMREAVGGLLQMTKQMSNQIQVAPAIRLAEDLLKIMHGTHGHNFRVDFFVGFAVEEHETYAAPETYLIDDAKLSAIVAKYNRCNLSLVRGLELLFNRGVRCSTDEEILDAFSTRATTENLAAWMCQELTVKVAHERWKRAKTYSARTGDLCCRVTVHETDSIEACVEDWLHDVAPIA